LQASRRQKPSYTQIINHKILYPIQHHTKMEPQPTRLTRFKEAMQSVYGPFDHLPSSESKTWTPPPKSGGHCGRYLWTDAFGVLNFLTLYYQTLSPVYLTLARAPIESNRFELYKSSIRPEGSNLYISAIRSKLANCSTNTNIRQTLVTYITCTT